MDLPDDVGDRILEELQGGKPPSHRQVLGTLLGAFATARGVPRWGEKTPRHLEWVPKILEDFPEARVVCVVRDPRDVTLSREKTPWESYVWRTVKDWRRHARMAEDHGQRFPDAFTEVRYEDILEEPEGTLREVCSFLNLSYEPEMLAFHEKGERTFETDQEPWKEKAREPIDPSNKEKWRDQMDPVDRWIVERVAKEHMDRHGYPRPEFSLSVGQTGRVAASYLGHVGRWAMHEAQWVIDNKLRSPSYDSPLDED